MITPRLAGIHFATAVATTQKAGERQLPMPRRSSGDGASLAGRIVGNPPLVPLELGPGDIALVLVLEQHVLLGQWAAYSAPQTLTQDPTMTDEAIWELEVESLRGATHGEHSPERISRRNGYLIGGGGIDAPEGAKFSAWASRHPRPRPFGYRSCASSAA
jgi:hypothetical protein